MRPPAPATIRFPSALALVPLLGQESSDGTMFLGDDLLPWLLVAFGGAMAAGTGLALVRPRTDPETGVEVPRPPLARSLVFIAIGALAALWGLASLVSG